jgi:hypothetical protein
MRSTIKTDVLKDWLRYMIAYDPFAALRDAKANTVGATGVSVPQQLVPVILKTLGYCCQRRARVHARPSSSESAATAVFLKPSDRYKVQERRSVLSVNKTCFGRNGGGVHGYSLGESPLYVLSNCTRMRISSSVLAAVDSVRGHRFVRAEGARKTAPATLSNHRRLFADVRRHPSIEQRNDCSYLCVRALGDSIVTDLFIISPCSRKFIPVEGVFSILKRNDRTVWRIAEAFSTQ